MGCCGSKPDDEVQGKVPSTRKSSRPGKHPQFDLPLAVKTEAVREPLVPLTERAVHPLFLQALCPLEVDIDGQRTKLADAYTWQVVRYFIKKETEETKQSLIETLAMLTAGEMPQDNYPNMVAVLDNYRTWAGGVKPFCGPVNFFVSHAWSYKFGDLVQMVRLHYEAQCGSDVRWFPWWYWVDVLAVAQNFSGDFKLHPDGNFPAVIRKSQSVVFTIHPWTAPVAPTRIWCLFEALNAVELGVELEFQLDPEFRKQTTPLEQLESKFRQQVVDRMDVGKAEATVEDDRKFIMSLLEKRVGGIRNFNILMQQLLNDRMLEVLLMRAIIGQNAEGGKKMITAGATFHHKRLRFKFARITDTSLEVISLALKTTDTLQALDLSPPNDRGLITGAGARHLAAALSTNSTLQELNLSQNPIGDVGGCAIADALCKNKTLTVLQLKKVKLDDMCVEALADMLKVNSVLQHLDISLNDDVTDDGLCALLEALTVNTTLRSLDLSWLPLADRKVYTRLAGVIKDNKGLEALVLHECRLHDDAVAEMAPALGANEYLKCLDLSHNAVHDNGAKALAPALEVNNFLEEIKLTKCGITLQGAKVLREALYKNSCLSHVALGGNEFKATDWEALGKGRSAKVNAQVLLDAVGNGFTTRPPVGASSHTIDSLGFTSRSTNGTLPAGGQSSVSFAPGTPSSPSATFMNIFGGQANFGMVKSQKNLLTSTGDLSATRPSADATPPASPAIHATSAQSTSASSSPFNTGRLGQQVDSPSAAGGKNSSADLKTGAGKPGAPPAKSAPALPPKPSAVISSKGSGQATGIKSTPGAFGRGGGANTSAITPAPASKGKSKAVPSVAGARK